MSAVPEFDDALAQRLPLPLAQLYRRAHNAKTPLERHLNAFYLWEAALKLMASGAVAVYGAAGQRDDGIEEQLRVAFPKPALGHWWGLATEIVPKLAARGDGRYQDVREFVLSRAHEDLPQAAQLNAQLAEFVGGRRGARATVRVRELVDRLIEFRNREVGHGASGARGDDFYMRWGPLLLAGAAEVLSRVDVLAEHRLAYRGGRGGGRADWWNLTGEHPVELPAGANWNAPRAEHVGCAYLIGSEPDAVPIPLHPLAHFDPRGPHFFFYNTGTGAEYEFLNYTTGEVRKAAPRWSLADLTAGTLPPLTNVLANPNDTITQPSALRPEELSHPKRIAGYEILGVLGRGGVATVYKAWQSTLGREVALKLFDSYDERQRAYARREAGALARTDHPNLVRIYEFGESDGCIYYTMELLNGTDLRRAAPELLPSALVPLFVQTSEALHALHAAGFIHRDVKPHNIIVAPDGGSATLIDLSIAGGSEQSDGLTVTGAVMGTYGYMSPEQARGQRVDCQTDVYSLGVVMWECLTKRRLREFHDRDEMLRAAQVQAPTLRSVNPTIDPALEAVVMKCLETDPRDRYANALELAEDLRRWLYGAQVRARPEGVASRARRAWRRNRRAFALVLVSAVASAVALVSAFNLGTQFGEDSGFPPVNGPINPNTQTPEQPVARGTAYTGWALAALFGALAGWQWARARRAPKATNAPAPPLDPIASVPVPPAAAEPEPVPMPVAPVPVAPVPAVAPETARAAPTVRAKLRTGDEAFSSQTVVLRYPAPIAIAYRRFCSRKEPAERVAQLFSTFEMTIKYLVYLAHSDLARARVTGGTPYSQLPTHSGFDFARRSIHMTLGRWLDALRAAADELADRDDRFFTELPEVCGTGGVIDREIVQWIKNNRNIWAHIEDGQSLTAEECARLLPEARPRLERLFQEIDFVRRYPLGFVTPGYTTGSEVQRYRVHSCMGARVAHGEEVYPMETAIRFPVGVPFVVAPDESAALCLWPFLLYRESDATQRPALYVFKSIEKDERFLSAVEVVAIDHKDTWSKRLAPPGAGGNHDWLWDQLAKLPQVVPITPDLRLADGLAESLVGRLTGESLGDKKQYKLMGPIARGGFGTVYDATDTRTGTRVAVKVLEDRDGLDPKEDLAQFKRFQQEYEKLKTAGAETKGFIRTFEWGTNIIGRREYPWFSMEFATGGDLTARLEERRTALAEVFPWNETESREAVIGEFRAIATAVANLHELGIVHRDIKPGNILVLDGGELRLSDFGLVKDIDRPRGGMSAGPGSSRGTVVGTRDYMAPEQERGETVTRAADVYALGILLAELASGRRPTPAGDTVVGSPVERDAHVQKLPETLRRLIVRCTNRDPEARPDDASHVLVEFERVAKKAG